MVTIIDRTGEQQEIKIDQRIRKFPKGKAELVLSDAEATHLFTVMDGKYRVHTVEGDFPRRYGVVDAPEGWVETVGVDVLETAPLTRDLSKLEGWDAAAVRTGSVEFRELGPAMFRGEYVNLGGDSPRVRS